MAATLLAQHVTGTVEIGREIRVGDGKDRLNPLPASIDEFLDGEFRAIPCVASHRPIGPGGRKQDADLHCVDHCSIPKREKPHDADPISDGASWGRNCPATTKSCAKICLI